MPQYKRRRPSALHARGRRSGRCATRSTCRCPTASPTWSRCSTSGWASSKTAPSRMTYHKLITRIETGAQRSALCLHVRERQCRRRHDGGSAVDAVPAAAERHADDGDAARRLPVRGGRRRGFGDVPDGVRSRPVERRRSTVAGGLRGGPSLHVGRSQIRLRPDPPRASRASPKRAANTACSSAWSPSVRPNSTPPSCRNAARCS